jgi:hypothetical protein
MSKWTKAKIILWLCVIGLLIGGGFYLGWKAYGKFRGVKIVEKIKAVEVPLDYDNPEYVKYCFKKASEETGINEKVFWAIKECEGGSAWAMSKTCDGGHFQINPSTGKAFGAKDLKALIDPCQSAYITAEILKKEGIKAWASRECIIQKLIQR